MKVNIEISYAGQTAIFTGIEFDDEGMVDESYKTGVETNNERIWENFMTCVHFTEIVRWA